jgi:hypothetical protein
MQNNYIFLTTIALITLMPNIAWSSPFDEDQDICPQWECDQAGNCREWNIPCNPSIPPSNPQGYELYFDGQLVSGSDAKDYTPQQAEENCVWNMQTKPQIHIRCLYNGQVFRER